MYEPSRRVEKPDTSLPKRMLLMAILAPFVMIALMSSPLLIDAVRHLGGL
jgi:hypothetical protein